MKRRLVLALGLVAVVGGSAGAALAAPAKSPGTNVCVVVSSDPGHQRTQDYCVNLPALTSP